MNLKVVQVTGLNTDQKAAQVISNPQDGENYFFAVLVLTSDDAFTKGRQVLSEISDFYIDLQQQAVGQKLTEAFKHAQTLLGEENFSLLLGAVSGKILYIQNIGEIEVYLKRLDKVSPLNFGAQGQLVSGFLQPEDRLLFATASLIKFLGEDLTKALELPLESFEEEIADRVGVAQIEEQGLAALLADIEPETKVAEEENKEVLVENQEENIPSLDQEEGRQRDQFYDQPTYASDSPKLNPISVIKKTLGSLFSFLWLQRTRLPKSNRGRLILAIVLIIILASGVGFQVKAKKDAQLNADFNQALQVARDEFNGAKGLATLNSVEAKAKLDSAKQKVDLALTLKPKDRSAEDLKKQIEQDSSSILQQFSVSEFPQFYDLDLVKKNFRPAKMSLSTGKILLLDTDLKTLVLVDVEKKSNQILAGSEQLGEAQSASLNGDLAFIYSKDKGILRIDTKGGKLTSVSKADEELGEIADLYSFAGNVYILDSGKNQIWKYLPTSEGYSDKREYLNKTTTGDFANSLRMQIESSIYILKNGGEVIRLTRGDKDHFSFDGLPSTLKDPKSLFVSSDTDNLYLLDSGNSRLLILSKTGVYKSEVSGEGFATATDLVVDEKGKKVYLLNGSKIYQVELQ